MLDWRLLLSLVLSALLWSCSKDERYLGYNVSPIHVWVVENGSQHDSKTLTEINESIRSLKIKDSDVVKKEFGYPARLKVQAFNVTAFAAYDDGWLVASGRGEWGGIVFWIDKDGGYEIIHDDDLAYPIDLVADGETLLLLQGMNHLGLADGSLLEIIRRNDKFTTTKYPLEVYPNKLIKHENDWVISIGRYGEYINLAELKSVRHIIHDPR